MKEKQKIRMISISIGFLIGLSTFFWTNLDSLEIIVFSIIGGILGYTITNPPQKRLLAGISGCIGIYLILVGTLPLYNNPPEESLFEQTRSIQYYVKGDLPETRILFNNEKGEKQISTQKAEQEIFFPESRRITITIPEQKFPSTFLVQTANGTIYIMEPESKISIEGEKVLEYTGNCIIKGIKEEKGKELEENYKKEKEKYILYQLGGDFFALPQIRKIQNYILLLAYKIHPSKYENNIQHYQEFAKLLQRKEQQKTTFEDKSDTIQQNILTEIKTMFKNIQANRSEE